MMAKRATNIGPNMIPRDAKAAHYIPNNSQSGMLALSISITQNTSVAIKQHECDSSLVVERDGQRYVV